MSTAPPQTGDDVSGGAATDAPAVPPQAAQAAAQGGGGDTPRVKVPGTKQQSVMESFLAASSTHRAERARATEKNDLGAF